MTPPRAVRAVVLGLALLGLLLVAQGSWIPAKGWLAQQLLERAWRSASVGGAAPRPWPWADTWPVARLSAPRLGVSLVVLEGSSGATLALGPGRHPAGNRVGDAGNVVLAGHRDTHFRFLEQLELGDSLLLDGPDDVRHAYTVIETRVAHENEVHLLDHRPRPTLTLLTCFPFDAPRPGGPLRYAVIAETSPH